MRISELSESDREKVYSILKELIKGYIDDRFDHSFDNAFNSIINDELSPIKSNGIWLNIGSTTAIQFEYKFDNSILASLIRMVSNRNIGGFT